MPRRIHVPVLRVGEIPLDPGEAHHLRNVLRLDRGQVVEVFDDLGRIAQATLVSSGENGLSVRVQEIAAPQPTIELSVAAAIPKGPRADWMVEKLSELGTARFIPLAARRSVVLPEGKGKHDRWMRIATESAKQSRRTGVMKIAALTRVEEVVASLQSADDSATAWYLSTAPNAMPISQVLDSRASEALLLLIGPEGGWADEEIALFQSAGILAISLTGTILRVETAAIAAAAIVTSMLQNQRPP